MRKIICVLLSFTLLCTSVFAEESEQKQKVIAVATFDITGNAVTQEEADAITELFITELVSAGKVSVVDRANFDKIVKEMKFQASDWSNSEKTAALGKAANAQLISRGQIIKLGSKLYLSSSVIDVKNAKVLSSAREQFNSLDDVFGLLGNFANDTIAKISRKVIDKTSLKIGDIGPGDGIVFYIEGNRAYEVSELLGSATWDDAVAMCKNYRGGGYNDWYLPTRDELNFIYQNLRKTEKILGNETYWSSSQASNDSVWYQNFSNGEQDHYLYSYDYFGFESKISNDKNAGCCVRAVRAF